MPANNHFSKTLISIDIVPPCLAYKDKGPRHVQFCSYQYALVVLVDVKLHVFYMWKMVALSQKQWRCCSRRLSVTDWELSLCKKLIATEWSGEKLDVNVTLLRTVVFTFMYT